MNAETVRWRTATVDDRRLALLWGLTAVVLLLASPLAPAIAGFLPSCAFRDWLGIPCATCGTSRAALALARGDPLDALRSNPLATLIAVVFLGGGIVAPIWIGLGARVPSRGPRGRVLVLGALAVLLANWVYLVVTGRG